MPTPLLNRIPDSYEVRAFTEDLRVEPDLGTFTGHASAFWYVDSWRTAFAKSAFRKTISDKEGRIPVLFFHDPEQMVGPAKVLREDREGLYHESQAIEDGRTGSYVLAHLRGGTPMGMSFGFNTRKDRAATDNDPIDLSTAPEGTALKDVRVITEVELFEISTLPWVFASQKKADISSVRSDVTAQSLQSLLEDLRAGTIPPDDARMALLHDLVAAYQAQPEPEPASTTPLPASDARRRSNDARVALALAHSRGWLGVPA